MSTERLEGSDSRMQAALDELCAAIARHYPDATFEVAADPEEPENVHLLTTVDLDDPDEVLDLVIDRLIELQVDERIPVHVIPIRSPQRILAERRAHPRLPRGLHWLVSSVEGGASA